MSVERTFVGPDVHAQAVVGAAFDAATGELVRRRLGASPAEVLAWLLSLPGPVAGVYEAGPTGFTLVRALRAAGVRFLSYVPRSAGPGLVRSRLREKKRPHQMKLRQTCTCIGQQCVDTLPTRF